MTGGTEQQQASGRDGGSVMSAKTNKNSKISLGYLRLLVSASPAKLDYLLLVVGIFSSIGAGIPFPLLGILFGRLVDELNSLSCSTAASEAASTQSAVASRVLDVIYVTIANFVLIYIAAGAWGLFGERLVRRLRYSYLQVLLRQEIAYFETLSTGEVASRLDNDLQTIQAGVSEKVGIVTQSISYFVTAYVVALMKDAKLAGMLFSLVPAYFIMALGGAYFTKKYAGAVEEQISDANAIASESLSHIRLVKAFGAAKRIEAMFVERLTATRRPVIGKILTTATQMGLLYFLAYSANALAISQGGKQIAETIRNGGSGVTVGDVYTVIFIIIDASYIISQVAPFLSIFAAASKAADKLVTTVNRDSKINPMPEAAGHKLSDVEGKVEFRQVSFRYPTRPEIPVLKSLNLVIPAGKVTGIVGLSGSGKSTISALIERLYDPDEGDVLIDGYSLKECNVRSIRGQTGLVEQNPVLMNRSVLENIAHGLVGSSKSEHQELQAVILDGTLADIVQSARRGEDIDRLVESSNTATRIVSLVRHASQLAGAESFVQRLNYSLATSVGPGGCYLSGGQKQRIALARALVRDPAILVLDEATASLDSATEASIQTALQNLPGTRTVISIAHRLSTVQHADNIAVMQPGGGIVEQGTYRELMSLDGAFASMVRLQMIKGESADDQVIAKVDTIDEHHATDPEKHDGHDDTAQAPPTGAEAQATDDQDPKPKKSSFFSVFLTSVYMARRQLLFIVFGMFASVIVGGSHSGEAVIFGNTIGRLNICRSASSVSSSASLFGLLFFILALIELFANIVSTASFDWVADKLVLRLRTMTIRSLLMRDLQWHESEGRTPGTLMSYISADASAMSGLTGIVLGITFSVIVNLVSGVILAHIVAWKIAIVLLACVPVLLVSGFLRLRLQAKFAERHAKAFANSVAIATEAVNSIKTVTAFSLQQDVCNEFRRSLSEPYDATLRSILFGNIWLAMSFSVGNLIYALAYWWGAKLQADGEYTQTQFFITLPALLFAAQTSGQLFSLSPDISKAAVAARRLLDFLRSGPTAKDLRGKDLELHEHDSEKAGVAVSRTRPQGGVSITFQDVHFSYPSRPDSEVLRGVSFDVPPGSFVAFVGTSGAGKSTIMALMEQFYQPSAGTIRLDNYDITTWQAEDDDGAYPAVLDDIGLVPQEPALFSGSVSFNIGLGARPDVTASQPDIEEAAGIACIHDTMPRIRYSVRARRDAVLLRWAEAAHVHRSRFGTPTASSAIGRV